MEALKGWLQLQSAGLLEVSGKARQIVTESQSFVQQRFATLVDQFQFSYLTKQCQQFLVKLSQQIRNGHLPLEYLIVGGDLVSVCVTFWFFFLGLFSSLGSLGEFKVRLWLIHTRQHNPPQFFRCNLFSLCLTALMLLGVLLALTVLAFLYRRSRLKAAAASGEDSGKQCKGMHHKAIPRREGGIFTDHATR